MCSGLEQVNELILVEGHLWVWEHGEDEQDSQRTFVVPAIFGVDLGELAEDHACIMVMLSRLLKCSQEFFVPLLKGHIHAREKKIISDIFVEDTHPLWNLPGVHLLSKPLCLGEYHLHEWQEHKDDFLIRDDHVEALVVRVLLFSLFSIKPLCFVHDLVITQHSLFFEWEWFVVSVGGSGRWDFLLILSRFHWDILDINYIVQCATGKSSKDIQW